MKRIIQAVVVAALFTGTQAQAGDGTIGIESQWTYADRHAAELAQGGAVDAFPGSAPEHIVLESSSTHADRHAAEIAQEVVASAFPGSAPEHIVLESMSTYADQFATERTRQASAAADPALSQ